MGIIGGSLNASFKASSIICLFVVTKKLYVASIAKIAAGRPTPPLSTNWLSIIYCWLFNATTLQASSTAIDAEFSIDSVATTWSFNTFCNSFCSSSSFIFKAVTLILANAPVSTPDTIPTSIAAWTADIFATLFGSTSNLFFT